MVPKYCRWFHVGTSGKLGWRYIRPRDVNVYRVQYPKAIHDRSLEMDFLHQRACFIRASIYRLLIATQFHILALAIRVRCRHSIEIDLADNAPDSNRSSPTSSGPLRALAHLWFRRDQAMKT